jgi:hypothetical protein
VVTLLWTMVGLDPDGAATVTASWLARAGAPERDSRPVGRLLDEAAGREGQGELTWHNATGTGTGTGVSHSSWTPATAS